jgi:hypothetical protein
MRGLRVWGLCGVLTMVLVLGMGEAALADSTMFLGLGPNTAGDGMGPTAMSADGSTVVGYMPVGEAGWGDLLYYWNGGLSTYNPSDGGWFPWASGLSSDGGRIVGMVETGGGRYATPLLYYFPSDGHSGAPGSSIGTNIELPVPYLSYSYARAIAGNGTVAGYVDQGTDPRVFMDGVPFSLKPGNVSVWHPTTSSVGLLSYAMPETIGVGKPLGISGNGRVVIGADASGHATRWAQGSTGWTQQDLGFNYFTGVLLTGLVNTSYASIQYPNMAASQDGNIIAGTEGLRNGSNSWSGAVRWSSANGGRLISLNMLGVDRSEAHGISGDGYTIIGAYQPAQAGGSLAFIWDPQNGMRKLRDVLVNDYGMGTALTGWSLQSADAISADGMTISGYGYHNGDLEAWLFHLDGAATGVANTTYRWKTPVSGDYETTGNWVDSLGYDGTRAPGHSDRVVFDQAGTYEVTLNDVNMAPGVYSERYLDSLAARAGDVTLFLNGQHLTISGIQASASSLPSLAVADVAGSTASLTLRDGATPTRGYDPATVDVLNGLSIGNAPAASGTLNIDGRYGNGNNMVVNVSGPVQIGGNGGQAALNVVNGGTLNTGVDGARSIQVLGKVRVGYDYDDAQQYVYGRPYVGTWNHTGDMTIGDGTAAYPGASLQVDGFQTFGAFQYSPTVTYTMSGFASTVAISGNLKVNNPAPTPGNYGTYALVVTDGGQILVGGNATVEDSTALVQGTADRAWAIGSSYGNFSGVVPAPNPNLGVAHDLVVGDQAGGELDIYGGKVAVGGSVTIGAAASSSGATIVMMNGRLDMPDGTLTVGQSGWNANLMLYGGQVHAKELAVAAEPGSYAQVGRVSDGAVLSVDNNIVIGGKMDSGTGQPVDGGWAYMAVQSYGSVTAGGTFHVMGSGWVDLNGGTITASAVEIHPYATITGGMILGAQPEDATNTLAATTVTNRGLLRSNNNDALKVQGNVFNQGAGLMKASPMSTLTVVGNVTNEARIMTDYLGVVSVQGNFTQSTSGILALTAYLGAPAPLQVSGGHLQARGALSVNYSEALNEVALIRFGETNPDIHFSSISMTGSFPHESGRFLATYQDAASQTWGLHLVAVEGMTHVDFANASSLDGALSGLHGNFNPETGSVDLVNDGLAGHVALKLFDTGEAGPAVVSAVTSMHMSDTLDLAFGYHFTTTSGKLQILVGDTILDTIYANYDNAYSYAQYEGIFDLASLGLTGDQDLTLRLSNLGDPGVVIGDLETNAAPLPEPATLSLLALGGLALLRRRRRQ